MNHFRYEHRHEHLSKRAGSDGHFSMLNHFEAVLVQKLSGFQKFWCFMKFQKIFRSRRVTYQFTFLTPPFHRKTLTGLIYVINLCILLNFSLLEFLVNTYN